MGWLPLLILLLELLILWIRYYELFTGVMLAEGLVIILAELLER